MPVITPSRRRSASALLASLALVGAVGLASCSSDSDGAASSTTVATTTTTVAGGATTTTTGGAGTTGEPSATATTEAGGAPSGPCTDGPAIPEGANQGAVPDVDGDGKADTGWVSSSADGAITVGIRTASGGGAEVPWNSASPARRTMLVVDAQQDGEGELLLDDGRTVQLFVFHDCAIVPATNPEGEPYTFSHGFSDVGTGIGCAEVDGHRRLVGLDGHDDGSGPVSWSQTVVAIDGTHATNGATTTGTYEHPADDTAIEALSGTTCGDLTIDANGIDAPSF